MKRVLALALVIVVGSAVAQNAPVVKPRASAKDYQAHGENANAVIGAAQLSSKQLRKTFVSNMRKDYIVVEVGVYPKNGFKLSPTNFTLRAANSDKPIAPADPKLMASQINEKDQKVPTSRSTPMKPSLIALAATRTTPTMGRPIAGSQLRLA